VVVFEMIYRGLRVRPIKTPLYKTWFPILSYPISY